MATYYKKRRRNKNIKRGIVIVIIVILLLIAGLFAATNVLYKTAMIRDDYDLVYEDKDKLSQNTVYVTELEGSDLSEVAFSEDDKIVEKWGLLNNRNFGLTGFAHLQPNYTNKWAVVVHGYKSNSQDMSEEGSIFFNDGYNVLVVDNEYHGQSEGDHISMGMYDSENIVQWCWQIVYQDSDAEIALYGLSMGAATVMMASSPDLKLPENVKVVVEDSGYEAMEDIFVYRLKAEYGLPRFPLINCVDALNYQKHGYHFEDRSPIEAVSKTELPMMFIHGTADDYVPFTSLDVLYSTHSGDKEKYVVEGATHGETLTVAGDVYGEKVLAFVNRYIK
ncbi:MAG: alpha/beta hydrolase [Lachnospirales bacterium]